MLWVDINFNEGDKMKRLILALILMFSVFAVNAETVVVNGLTPEQIAQVQLTVAQQKAANDKGSSNVVASVTPDSVQKWADLGKAVGVGLVATAKELGMAANDLLKTDVGKIAMALIIWNIAGKSLVGVIFGFTWLLLVIPTWVVMFRKYGVREVRQEDFYDKGKREDGKRRVVVYTSTSEQRQMMYWVSLLITIAVGLIAIF